MKKNIRENIINNLDFLKAMGFAFQSKFRESNYDSTKKIEELFFVKDSIKIEISYNEFVDCKVINLSIEHIDKKSSFNFEEYLQFKSQNKNACIGDLNESDDQYIKRFFSLFKTAIDSDLGDVIKGKIWIDVPRDYGNYK